VGVRQRLVGRRRRSRGSGDRPALVALRDLRRRPVPVPPGQRVHDQFDSRRAARRHRPGLRRPPGRAPPPPRPPPPRPRPPPPGRPLARRGHGPPRHSSLTDGGRDGVTFRARAPSAECMRRLAAVLLIPAVFQLTTGCTLIGLSFGASAQRTRTVIAEDEPYD